MRPIYPLSKSILAEIKKASNILVNTHKNPDYDSIASATALKQVLETLGKKVKIVSCQKINPYFNFIKGADEIEVVNFKDFKDFRLYDLFIIPDTGSADRVTGFKEVSLPEKLNYIVIDHHRTNDFTYPLRLLDETAAATCEVLYHLFSEWKVNINPALATILLTGVMGDSVFLRYTENSQKTFKVVNDLIGLGADKDFIEENFYERYGFNEIKFLGEFLKNLKMEKQRFVWSAIPLDVYEKFGKPEGIREMAADLFFRGIIDTDFGVAMVESKKGVINMSFRSKKDVDVTNFAKLFGGGGHKNAAGATIYGSFYEAVEKAIDKIAESTQYGK